MGIRSLSSRLAGGVQCVLRYAPSAQSERSAYLRIVEHALAMPARHSGILPCVFLHLVFLTHHVYSHRLDTHISATWRHRQVGTQQAAQALNVLGQ